jgi:hypothetical protein
MWPPVPGWSKKIRIEVKKSKSFPGTCRGGSSVCETSRLPHLLDTLLTDGSETVSLTRRRAFTPRKIPGTHFC